jgi:hypothetical protein
LIASPSAFDSASLLDHNATISSSVVHRAAACSAGVEIDVPNSGGQATTRSTSTPIGPACQPTRP